MAELLIDILDVGQGDGILIQFPNKKIMLNDLGSRKNKVDTLDALIKYWKKNKDLKNRTHLEWVVLSHGDDDHYNLVEEFLNKVGINTVGNVIYGGDRAGSYGALIDHLEKNMNATVFKDPGKRPFELVKPKDFGGVKVRVLAWNAVAPSKDKNANSVVLQLEFAGKRVMLPGDATRDTERAIVQLLKTNGNTKQLLSDALKAEHHGSSRTSFDPEWVSLVNPKHVFFTADRHETYKLPRQLAVSIIQTYGTRLENKRVLHDFSADYETADYQKHKGWNGTKVSDPGLSPGWNATKTDLAIWTTLVGIDRVYKGKLYDQGAQYQITITDSSPDLDVTNTDT